MEKVNINISELSPRFLRAGNVRLESKKQESMEIDRHIAEFEKSGGVIQQIKPGLTTEPMAYGAYRILEYKDRQKQAGLGG